MEAQRRPVGIRFWVGAALLVGLLAFALRLRMPVVAAPLPRSAAISRALSPIGRHEIAAGASHSYGIRLAAGEAFHAAVEQIGVEVALSLDAPSGKHLLALTAPDWSGGTQEIYFIAQASGDYRLTVAGYSGAGEYRLRLDKPHPAAGRDRLLGKATAALSKGDELRARQPVDAGRAYRRAAALSEQAGEPRARALALYRTGTVEEEARSREDAIARYGEALAIWRIGAEANAARNAIGRCQSALGQTDVAFHTFQKVADGAKRESDRRARAAALSNTAQLYVNRGKYQQAIDLYREARQIFADLRLEDEEAVTLDDLSEVWYALGASQEAIDACEQARAIQERIGDRRDLLLSLRDLGAAYLSLKQWDTARALFQQTARLAHDQGVMTVEAGAENGLSYVYLKQGSIEQALEVGRTALRLARSVDNPRLVANALGNLAAIEGRQRNIAEALHHFDEARRIYQREKMPGEEASILFGRAEVLEIASRLDDACSTIHDALDIVEGLRTTPDGSDLRASFFALRQDYFELYIRILMRLDEVRPGRGYAGRAFEASEQTHARTLLDGLALASFDVGAGADEALVRHEAALQRQLGTLEDKLLHPILSAPRRGDIEHSRLGQEIRERQSELDQVRGKMRRSNRRYAAIEHSRPLSLTEIQREVLDPGTLLLVYSLGDKGSFLWSVDRTSLRSYRLPDRRTIEDAAGRAHDALQDDDEAGGDLGHLSEMLLRPVAGDLGGRRLLIVADGALQYVPFAALREPLPRGLGDVLLAAHEITYLPSASVARRLRQEQSARAPAPMDVALLGDPVFGLEDERLSTALRGLSVPELARITGSSGTALRSVRDIGLDGLRRLPYSGREIDAIFRLVPSGRGLKAVGFDATRELAMSSELTRYHIVHFATHGFLDAGHPELAGLVLSMVDPQGRPRDGFLHAYEIYSLRWSADLVVLSACRTALGTEVRGEGVLGLTRGFMYAGAPRVVVSLWDINDQATADLMQSFYGAMLRQHLPPAAALRAAQLSLRKSWPSPHHWAAFELQGDWR